MTGGPDRQTLRATIALACRAPSVHNSQPWQWRTTDNTVQLFADRSRHLARTDPHGRDLVMSCGAALHHLQMALAAAGWRVSVHRVPDSRHPDHLATVEVTPGTATDAELALAAAIPHRRSERRRLSSWEVPSQLLQSLTTAAQGGGSLLVTATDPVLRGRLVTAVMEAAVRQNSDLAYDAELLEWSGRGRLSDDGVPAASVPAGRPAERTLRSFRGGTARGAHASADRESAEELLILGTTSDDVRSQLLAGEALSAVLLTATALGLSTCPLTQALEVDEIRRHIRVDLLDGTWTPQVLVRVGWLPALLDPLPETPRRRVDFVLATWEEATAR